MVHHSSRTLLKHSVSMSEEKKLAKRLRMFKQFDEATLAAAFTTTRMEHRELKAANEGMERLYNISKMIDEISTENEHTKTTSLPN